MGPRIPPLKLGLCSSQTLRIQNLCTVRRLAVLRESGFRRLRQDFVLPHQFYYYHFINSMLILVLTLLLLLSFRHYYFITVILLLLFY